MGLWLGLPLGGGGGGLVVTTSLEKLVYSRMWHYVICIIGASLLEECFSKFLLMFHSHTTYIFSNKKYDILLNIKWPCM
jgi:hypothetical protein